MPLQGSSCLLEFRPAGGLPTADRKVTGRGAGLRGAGPRRSSAGHHHSDGGNRDLHDGGFLANTLMNYDVHYAVNLHYDAYSMPVNAVDLRSLSCRSILSVIKMRAR
jgi:hypothetical protein